MFAGLGFGLVGFGLVSFLQVCCLGFSALLGFSSLGLGWLLGAGALWSGRSCWAGLLLAGWRLVFSVSSGFFSSALEGCLAVRAVRFEAGLRVSSWVELGLPFVAGGLRSWIDASFLSSFQWAACF